MFHQTKETYLKIKKRNHNQNKVHQSSRPRNFNNESIEPKDYLKKRLECIRGSVIVGEIVILHGMRALERMNRDYKIVLEFADK